MRACTFLGTLCALLFATACSSDAPSPQPRAGAPAARAPAQAPTGHIGYAFPSRDASYASVLAEARRTGRPALLFFWTSW